MRLGYENGKRMRDERREERLERVRLRIGERMREMGREEKLER